MFGVLDTGHWRQIPPGRIVRPTEQPIPPSSLIVQVDHLPFFPFPEEGPEYIPSRDVADHLENYQRDLGLHVLTSAQISAVSYDSLAGTWTISISRSGKPSITVLARHLITATGVGTLGTAVPVTPSIPGKVCTYDLGYLSGAEA